MSPDRHINFRIGVHVGDVMIRGGDLFGDGVNIAARLQTIAKARSVCIRRCLRSGQKNSALCVHRPWCAKGQESPSKVCRHDRGERVGRAQPGSICECPQFCSRGQSFCATGREPIPSQATGRHRRGTRAPKVAAPATQPDCHKSHNLLTNGGPILSFVVRKPIFSRQD